MKGLRFTLDLEHMRETGLSTSLGWYSVEIVERSVYKIETKGDTSFYRYELLIIGINQYGMKDFASLQEEEFMEEVCHGIYKLV